MANPDRPSGFTPVQYLNGAPWNGQARIYSIIAAYTTALYIGDPAIQIVQVDSVGVPPYFPNGDDPRDSTTDGVDPVGKQDDRMVRCICRASAKKHIRFEIGANTPDDGCCRR